MINIIKHSINLARCYFRDVGLGVKRSGQWPTVEKHFREANPNCAACGSNEHINIHHIFPFHKYPHLELDPNNLITMCMSKLECHLRLAHCGNFKTFNPNIKRDAAEVLKHSEKMEEIIKTADKHKLVN